MLKLVLKTHDCNIKTGKLKVSTYLLLPHYCSMSLLHNPVSKISLQKMTTKLSKQYAGISHVEVQAPKDNCKHTSFPFHYPLHELDGKKI